MHDMRCRIEVRRAEELLLGWMILGGLGSSLNSSELRLVSERSSLRGGSSTPSVSMQSFCLLLCVKCKKKNG